MHRGKTTVEALYQEWHEGCQGWQSVKYMDEKYGAKWRRTDGEKQFYRRRKAIVNTIDDVAKGREIHGLLVQLQKQLYDSEMSLDKLAKRIIEAKRESAKGK